MKKTLLSLTLLLSISFHSATVGTASERSVKGKIEDAVLTHGFTVSICAQGLINGFCEGYRFRSGGGGTYVVKKSDYHAWSTAQQVASISAGMCAGLTAYANYSGNRHHLKTDIIHAIGALCWRRNLMEWGYKWQRYNNPFDYTKEHNQAALVYFGFRNGKIVDLYLGTGPVTGPLVDLGFGLLGAWLLNWE